MPKPAFALAVLSSWTVSVSAPAQEAVDEKAVEFFRAEGLERSQVMDHLSWICDVHGPRLTGSRNLERAQVWAQKTLRGWGMEAVKTHEWGPFGDGWSFEHFSARITGENPWPVLAYPKAWSPATNGTVEAEVVYVADLSADALDEMDLKGKIVMVETPREVSEPFDGTAKRHGPQDLFTLVTGATPPPDGSVRSGDRMRRGFQRSGQIFAKVYAKQPAVILNRYFKGDYGTIFVSPVQKGGKL